ncbi:hypothetical protein HKBW3S43_00100, partial [Candidatus Hakubella thermalkaliphila]
MLSEMVLSQMVWVESINKPELSHFV